MSPNYYILFIVFCISCNNVVQETNSNSETTNNVDSSSAQNEVTDTTTQISFEEYVEQIPVLPIGYKAECTGSLGIIDLADNTYTPEGTQAIGRMQSMDDWHFIIYAHPADIQMPMMHVFTTVGDDVHREALLDLGACASVDPGFNNGTSSFVIIAENAIERKKVIDVANYDATLTIDTLYVEDLIEKVGW